MSGGSYYPHLQYKEDVKIPVPWGHLAAKVWGPDDGVPVLALHGWLDNAGSFDALAPLLPPNLRLVCLEFCGYGHSPYPPGMLVCYFDHIYHTKLVIDHFGWKKFILMGHSMGGYVALNFAAIYPELVERLIVLDAANQTTVAELLPPRVRKVLDDFHELSVKQVTGMSYEQAADRIPKSLAWSIVDGKGAEFLVPRGIKKIGEDHDVWALSRDLRSLIRPYVFNDQTVEQFKAVIREITCPLLLIKAKDDDGFGKEHQDEYNDIFKNTSVDFRLVPLDGRHHVHLTHPESVAPHIINFLSDSPLNRLYSKL